MDLLSDNLIKTHHPNLGNTRAELNLTEKIVQFGTGMLLRALPDYLIHQANRKGLYNGSIVAIKSTSPDTHLFRQQDCLYTVIEKGPNTPKNAHSSNGKTVVTALSRVLAAETEWEDVLACARNPEITIVISNTTEAGLTYLPEKILNRVPDSFPGKLTAYLFERFLAIPSRASGTASRASATGASRTSATGALGTSMAYGMVILPTELVVNNGQILRDFVLRHAEENGLPEDFSHWIKTQNYFCNTLVDRIVPGRCEEGNVVFHSGLFESLRDPLFEDLGDSTELENGHRGSRNGNFAYRDDLHTAAEPYLLWAIEGNSEVRDRLKFVQADERIIVTDNIEPYRERKLRILNGSNTHVAGIGFLAGCSTTFDTMEDSLVARYTEDLILKEIVPTIQDLVPDATTFAHETMDRFRNPEIRYPLLQIALQYSSKMNSRNAETFFRYYQKDGAIPTLNALGLAAYFVFNTPAGSSDGKFYGEHNGTRYTYRDDHASFVGTELYTCCTAADFTRAVTNILKNKAIFTKDLTEIPGLTAYVVEKILDIRQHGMRMVLEKML